MGPPELSPSQVCSATYRKRQPSRRHILHRRHGRPKRCRRIRSEPRGLAICKWRRPRTRRTENVVTSGPARARRHGRAGHANKKVELKKTRPRETSKRHESARGTEQ